MSKQITNKNPELDQKEILPLVDKYLLLEVLSSHVDESSDIAEYIGDNIRYGRALGYTEGKATAYNELIGRILNGEFDANVVVEDDYEYKM